MKKDRVIVAMSGGVDSSVAALMLHDMGYDVIGVTMKLYDNSDISSQENARGCCTVDDVEDARSVCASIGVPHYVFNVQREFQAFVIDYFLREYELGRTPHPCIACNDKIKFSFLMDRAMFLDCRYIATGHYARISHQDGAFHLLRGIDQGKDQSYVLYGMSQSQLSQTLMPIGWHAKADIRSMAITAGLPNANKPDSQDICFIPMGNYREFISRHRTPTPGQIITTAGEVIGRHQGLEFFTVGQRRGLGSGNSEPVYVVRIDSATNSIIVGTEKELFKRTFWTTNVKYTSGVIPDSHFDVNIKIRYKSPYCSARIFPQGNLARIELFEPQRAITPGQAAVFYSGEELVGGGVITDCEPDASPDLGVEFQGLAIHSGAPSLSDSK